MNYAPPRSGFTQSDIDAFTRVLRALELSIASEKASNGEPSQVGAHYSKSPDAVALAFRLKAARANRSNFFDDDIFGEPAWDMMLALYSANGEGYRLKVSALCAESCVPPTTSLRWINRLIDTGLARKVPNPTDARSCYIEATDKLVNQMTDYLNGVLKSQLNPKPRSR